MHRSCSTPRVFSNIRTYGASTTSLTKRAAESLRGPCRRLLPCYTLTSSPRIEAVWAQTAQSNVRSVWSLCMGTRLRRTDSFRLAFTNRTGIADLNAGVSSKVLDETSSLRAAAAGHRSPSLSEVQKLAHSLLQERGLLETAVIGVWKRCSWWNKVNQAALKSKARFLIALHFPGSLQDIYNANKAHLQAPGGTCTSATLQSSTSENETWVPISSFTFPVAKPHFAQPPICFTASWIARQTGQ